MTTYDAGTRSSTSHIATVHRVAISVAFVSGSLALIAMLFGSPLQIGSAMAVCGAAWIVVHLSEQFAAQNRAAVERLVDRPVRSTFEQRVIFGPSSRRVPFPADDFGRRDAGHTTDRSLVRV